MTAENSNRQADTSVPSAQRKSTLKLKELNSPAAYFLHCPSRAQVPSKFFHRLFMRLNVRRTGAEALTFWLWDVNQARLHHNNNFPILLLCGMGKFYCLSLVLHLVAIMYPSPSNVVASDLQFNFIIGIKSFNVDGTRCTNQTENSILTKCFLFRACWYWLI